MPDYGNFSSQDYLGYMERDPILKKMRSAWKEKDDYWMCGSGFLSLVKQQMPQLKFYIAGNLSDIEEYRRVSIDKIETEV
ncbi:UNVERIFIED_CONTAM: hypothetical protein NCL1_35525 [Trichonephila clavipes]